MRTKKEIEIRKNGEWVPVSAIISESLLCKRSGCNRKPGGGRHTTTLYCSVKCAQKDMWRNKK